MAIPVMEIKGDGKKPACEVCGSEDTIMHSLHPDYPSDLERLLVARGIRGEELVRRIKKYADFNREPEYVLPGIKHGLPDPPLFERQRRLTPGLINQAIARFDARADEVKAKLREAESAALRGDKSETRRLVAEAQKRAYGMTHEFRGLWD